MRKDRLEKRSEIMKRLNQLEDTFDAQKSALQSVESKIMALVGTDWESVICRDEEEETLRLLLFERKSLLDRMFLATDEECQRMVWQNQRLHELTIRVKNKMADICEELATKPKDDFVDDYEVRGTVCFDFGDLDDFYPLPGAECYGSNFPLMMSAIYMLDEKQQTVEYHCHHTDDRETILEDSLDDDQSWAHEIPVSSNFEGTYIWHTTVDFCRDMYYAVLDVLQMKTFWSEVVVQYQNFGRTQSP